MYSFKHLFIQRQSRSVSCAWVWRAACLFLNYSILYKQENACMHDTHMRTNNACMHRYTHIHTYKHGDFSNLYQALCLQIASVSHRCPLPLIRYYPIPISKTSFQFPTSSFLDVTWNVCSLGFDLFHLLCSLGIMCGLLIPGMVK